MKCCYSFHLVNGNNRHYGNMKVEFILGCISLSFIVCLTEISSHEVQTGLETSHWLFSCTDLTNMSANVQTEG